MNLHKKYNDLEAIKGINLSIKKGEKIDYISVCTPNYLHDAHTRYGLRLGCDVICEKPVVLNPWNIDTLEAIEKSTGKKAYTIFQLRLHESIVALKKKIDEIDKLTLVKKKNIILRLSRAEFSALLFLLIVIKPYL